MASSEMWMRSLHILFALLWAGGGLYRGMVVERVARADDGFRDRFFASSIHGPYMGVTALLAIVFGSIRLGMGSGDPGEYDMDALGGGFFLFHGALGLAVLAFVVGLAGHMPTDLRLKRIAAARLGGLEHDDVVFHRLLRREVVLTRVSGLLISLAVLGMVFFRAAA